jgi:hypothetical protein
MIICNDPTVEAAAAKLAPAGAGIQVWPVKTTPPSPVRASRHPISLPVWLIRVIQRHAEMPIPSGRPFNAVLQPVAPPPSSGDPWTERQGFRDNAAPAHH